VLEGKERHFQIWLSREGGKRKETGKKEGSFKGTKRKVLFEIERGVSYEVARVFLSTNGEDGRSETARRELKGGKTRGFAEEKNSLDKQITTEEEFVSFDSK